MAEAVIVACTRTPIGRARKGSLTGVRADDLAALAVRAALSSVPALPADLVEDVVVGCAQPAGEQGYNLGRVVAILAGLRDVPGTTVNRYCASSLQALRIAAHAIRAGEGEAFVAAGVEAVSRYSQGKADGMPDTHNPRFAAAETRTGERAIGGAPQWTAQPDLPDIYIAMGQTAENVAELENVAREEMDAWAALSHRRAVATQDAGHLRRRDHAGAAARRRRGVRRRLPAARHECSDAGRTEAGLPPGRPGDRGQLVPAQ